MNRLLNSNQVSTALVSQTDYQVPGMSLDEEACGAVLDLLQVLCFAEDDWPIEVFLVTAVA